MGIRQVFFKGVKWSLIQQVFTQLINYVSIFWLAVLITPEDFGKVALVIVFIGIFEAINGFGVSQLIVRDNITELKIISSYFWYVASLSLALTAFALLLSIVYLSFFNFEHGSEFQSLILVSAASLVINGINSVYNALYSRDLNFRTPSKYFVLSLFLGNSVAIVAAHFGLGYWALILKNLLPVGILTLCFALFSKYKIRFYFDYRCVRNTWNFGSHLTYFNALNYLVRNLDYIIIGKFFDLGTVGQYSIAYKIMIFPMKNITARVQSVLYPLLTKMQDDVKRLERTYFLIVSAIGYLTFPFAALLSSLAFLWVPLFFDIVKYDKLIVLVEILSVVGAVQAITSPVMSLYLLTGRTKPLFHMGLFIALINGLGFFAGALSGNIYMFALIYAGIQLFISIPLSNYVPFQLMSFDFFNFIKKLLAPFLAAVASYVIVNGFVSIVQTGLYLRIVILGGIAVGSYLAVLLLISGTSILERAKQLRLTVSGK